MEDDYEAKLTSELLDMQERRRESRTGLGETILKYATRGEREKHQSEKKFVVEFMKAVGDNFDRNEKKSENIVKPISYDLRGTDVSDWPDGFCFIPEQYQIIRKKHRQAVTAAGIDESLFGKDQMFALSKEAAWVVDSYETSKFQVDWETIGIGFEIVITPIDRNGNRLEGQFYDKTRTMAILGWAEARGIDVSLELFVGYLAACEEHARAESRNFFKGDSPTSKTSALGPAIVEPGGREAPLLARPPAGTPHTERPSEHAIPSPEPTKKSTPGDEDPFAELESLEEEMDRLLGRGRSSFDKRPEVDADAPTRSSEQIYDSVIENLSSADLSVRKGGLERVLDINPDFRIASGNGKFEVGSTSEERGGLTHQQAVDTACAAMDRISDQRLLTQLAFYHSHLFIRHRAVQRLTDQATLVLIARNDVEETYIRETAINRIQDTQLAKSLKASLPQFSDPPRLERDSFE